MWQKIVISLSTLGLWCCNQSAAKGFIPIFDSQGNNMGSDFSIEDLNPINNSGSFEASEELQEFLGYDPSREWNNGDNPEDVIKIGDLQDFGIQSLSLEQIANQQGLSFERDMSLAEVGFFEGQSLNQLSNAISGFNQLTVDEVAPLADLLGEQYSDLKIEDILDKDSSQIQQTLKDKSIEEIEFYVVREFTNASDRISQYLAQNGDRVIENINSYIDDNYSQLSDDLSQITNQSQQLAQAQIEDYLSQKQAELTAEISDYVSANYEQGTEAIEQYISQQTEQYVREVNDFIDNTNQQIQDNITSYLAESLDDLDSAVTEAITDEIEQYAADSFEELKEYANEFINEQLATVKEDVSNYASEQISQVSAGFNIFFDNIGEIELSDYDLSEYSVSDVPGLSDTALEEFAGYENQEVSDVPGVSSLNIDEFPILPNLGIGIAQIDLVFSEAEKYAKRTISGSDREGFFYTFCDELDSLNGGCAHIELGQPIFFNEGKQWVTGDSQEVEGGKNLLRPVNGGKEPTGRLPFPEAPFKMVLRNNNEETDTTELLLSFRFCFTDPFGVEHCTPYSLFEIPFITLKVGDYIYLGI